MMILYRAMCEDEAKNTKIRPSFVRRYKFFTHKFDFVRNRVMDGRFNNSNIKTNRYTHLGIFHIKDEDIRWFSVKNKELMLDVRNIQHIHWLHVWILKIESEG